MAHQPKGSLYAWIGLVTWGDIGHLTVYKRKDGRLVVFKKTWPEKPASPDQATQRAAFSAAIAAWNALPPADRAQWKTAAARASLTMTGLNLYLSNQLAPDPTALATLARQTATTIA